MTLKEEAKALGIKGYHLMKDETLIKAIAEAKQDTEGENEEVISVVVREAVKPEQPEAVEKQAEVVPEKPAVRVYEIKHKEKKIRLALGVKHRKYLEFVSMYRDFIPAEYAAAKPMIDKYL